MTGLLVATEANTHEQKKQLVAAAKRTGCSKLVLFHLGKNNEDLSCLDVCVVVVFSAGQHIGMPEGLQEDMLCALRTYNPQVVLAPADAFGNRFILRYSVLLGTFPVLELTDIHSGESGLCISRRTHGFSVKEMLCPRKMPVFYSVRLEEFMPDENEGSPSVFQRNIAYHTPWQMQSNYKSVLQLQQMQEKKLILVGGAGLGSAENAKQLMALGEKLNAGVCATRAALHRGWFPPECLVGASGLRLKAERCAVFGASGARPLMIGIEKCSYILAVNTDKSAPIFDYCNEGLHEDCNEVIRQLLNGYT